MLVEIDLCEYERHVKNDLDKHPRYIDDRGYYDDLIENTVEWFYDCGYSPGTMVDCLLFGGITVVTLSEHLYELSEKDLENYFMDALYADDKDPEKANQLVKEFNNYENNDIMDFLNDKFSNHALSNMFEKMVEEIGNYASIAYSDEDKFRLIKVD